MKLSRTVWALGFVSLFMDISSEMIHSLLPIFLVTQLGVSALVLGTIEGVAESIALFMKAFSGAMSDWMRKRKLLIVIGYLLAALTKPFFAFSHQLSWIMVARFTDRMGKGIRGAPRDALIADVTEASQRGAAFGLRQSLDTWGAVIGPLIAMIGMFIFADNFQAVFMVAIVPAFISVFILMVFVKEPKVVHENTTVVWPLKLSILKDLPKAFWWVFILAFVFTLARFSEAFLILRAQTLGLELALTPLVLILLSVVFALSAYPFGKLSDTFGRFGLLALSLILLIIANAILATATHYMAVLIGVLFWGLHLGASQGILSALIADTAPLQLRATAFGLFSLSGGFATLMASILAGLLWTFIGANVTFIVGGLLALLTLIIMFFYKRSSSF
ncbi:MAG: MFS transporter [Gammaproteobacteria bacterium]|jgi:MFS family permease